MKHKLFMAVLFACFGVTAEIIFTGIKYNVVLPVISNEEINYSLAGTSYVWMLFIYGAIPFIFPIIYKRVKHLNVLFRIIIYAVISLCIEFIAGWLLDLITGDCPWRYTEGFHLLGYIRLDYFPIWMFFGFCIEWLWLKINHMLVLKS